MNKKQIQIFLQTFKMSTNLNSKVGQIQILDQTSENWQVHVGAESLW